MDNKVLNKALCYSYILGKLQMENLEVAVHEMVVISNPNAQRLRDKLEKISSANKNAFRIMERNISEEELENLRSDMDKVLGVIWETENV